MNCAKLLSINYVLTLINRLENLSLELVKKILLSIKLKMLLYFIIVLLLMKYYSVYYDVTV